MAFWIYLLLFYAPSLIEDAHDPWDGWLAPGIDLRDLDCDPLPIEGARRVAEAALDLPGARADFLQRRAVVCRERLMPHGVRRAQDDAILSQLRLTADDLGSLVANQRAALGDRTWLVEVYYPDPAVGQKVAFAAKNALTARGLRVTDRAPTLAAGDLEVIGGLPPEKAYPLACARYAAAGALRAGDALMAVALRHPRETALHLGVCADGAWRWLR